MVATCRFSFVRAWLVATAGLLQGVGGAGCGPGDPEGTTSGLSSGEPVVTGVVPAQLTAGDEVQILGNHFCGAQESCRSRVTFEGTFQGPAGAEAVQIEAQGVTYKNDGTLSWTFGPNVPFSARGQIGTFSGTVRVFNEGAGGTQSQGSTPYRVQLMVGPSILIRRMGPMDGNCGAGGLTETTENTSLAIEVEAVGLQPGHSGAPLWVTYSVPAANFSLDGRFQDRFNGNPQDLTSTQGMITLVDRVENGSVSVVGGAATSRMRVLEQGLPSTNSGSGLFDYLMAQLPIDYDQRFTVNGLSTRALSQQRGVGTTATISIQAIDGAGNVTSRSLLLRVWPVIELKRGEMRKVRDYAPELVSGCIQGSSPPASLTYTDQRTETKQRLLSSKVVVKPQFGVAAGSILQNIVGIHAQVETELGIQLDESISSAQMNGWNLQVQVLPGQVAMVYRQLTQLEQRLDALVHTACGQAEDAGYLILTDWTWGLEVARAQQQTCNPVPPTKLIATDYGAKF